MLLKPNVKEIVPKVGNRYQAVLAISKRARELEAERVLKINENKEKAKENYKDYLYDAVDVAAKEIAEGKVHVKINGEFVVTPEAILDKEIQAITDVVKEKDKE